MAYQIQLRNDTDSNWANVDPILAQGEPGYETNTGKIKYGDGVSAWSALPYFATGGGGNTTPGGPNNSIQFNANGTFSGSSFFSVDTTNSIVNVSGSVAATYFIGDGSQLTNLPGANLANYAGNIVPAANNVYSLGNATNQWAELWVSNSTIYIGGLPLSSNDGNLTFNGLPVVSQSNTGNTSITNLDVTGTAYIPDLNSNTMIANFIAGDGSQIYNIQYTSVIGAYGDANVSAFLPSYDGELTSLTGDVTTAANVTAAYFVGDGSQLTNLPVGDYSNSNVEAYLPTYDGELTSLTGDVTTAANVTANYFLGDGSLLTNLPIQDAYSNANVAAYLPVYSGNILGDVVSANSFSGDGNGLSNIQYSNIVGAYSDSNVAAYLPTYTGNLDSLTGNVVTVANVSANYVLGNAAFMTGLDFATGYSNANVANFLPVYSGNISANVISANTIDSVYEVISERTNANTIVFGNASVTVSEQTWAAVTASGLSNVILYQVAANSVGSVDFNVTATSGNNRQVAKIVAVTINGLFNYSEYGSLTVGNNICNFTVDLVSGNLTLNSEPFIANSVDYTVIINGYA